MSITQNVSLHDSTIKLIRSYTYIPSHHSNIKCHTTCKIPVIKSISFSTSICSQLSLSLSVSLQGSSSFFSHRRTAAHQEKRSSSDDIVLADQELDQSADSHTVQSSYQRTALYSKLWGVRIHLSSQCSKLTSIPWTFVQYEMVCI